MRAQAADHAVAARGVCVCVRVRRDMEAGQELTLRVLKAKDDSEHCVLTRASGH